MIKDTDTPAEIKEKLMLLAAFALTAIGFISIGKINWAPLAGFVSFFSLFLYFVHRAQKARRKEQAAALIQNAEEV
jgi:Ca2+/Na+ antiporter